MIYTIRKYGDPVLREPTSPVEEVTPEIQELADDMVTTMRAASGVGLAAPQIGLGRAMCVVELPEEYDTDEEGQRINPNAPSPLVLINPQLVERSPHKAEAEEGCLSLPDITGSVRRPTWIRVTYRDREGEEQEVSLTGFFARAVQHEIDHLHGILILDHFSRAKRMTLSKRLKQLREESTQSLTSSG